MPNDTMTFGVDLIPSGDNQYNLGDATHKWKINGVTPVLTDTDEKVKNITVTSATTYYLTGSFSSDTATGTLNKHAAIKGYVTANSSTNGSARIDLGNTTATTTAGGKEGILRLYGTTATYYADLKAGAPSENRTFTFPNKSGTIALTTDIPDISGKIDTAGTGLSKSGTTLNHSNSITAKNSYGSTATTTSANGGTIKVTDVQYDAQGHITASTDRTITLSQTTYSNFVKSGTGAAAGLVPAPSTTAGTTKFLCEDGTWAIPTEISKTDLLEIKKMALAAYPTDAVNGPIAIFNDGADDIPLKSLLIDISSSSGVTGAKITLSGNDNLFVPFTYSARGITMEINDDGTMWAHGTATSAGWLVAYNTVALSDSGLDIGDTFTLSCSSNAQFSIRFWDSSDAEISRTGAATVGNPVTTTIPSGTSKLRIISQLGMEQIAIGDVIDITAWYQIEKGEGNLYSITFPTAVGTIYDGTLDVLAGKLTVNNQTYDVTPLEISTSLGNNAIYTDCGDVSVIYRADPTLYIDRKIAESIPPSAVGVSF